MILVLNGDLVVDLVIFAKALTNILLLLDEYKSSKRGLRTLVHIVFEEII